MYTASTNKALSERLNKLWPTFFIQRFKTFLNFFSGTFFTIHTCRGSVVVDLVSDVHALENGSQNLSDNSSALNLHENVLSSYRPHNSNDQAE